MAPRHSAYNLFVEFRRLEQAAAQGWRWAETATQQVRNARTQTYYTKFEFVNFVIDGKKHESGRQKSFSKTLVDQARALKKQMLADDGSLGSPRARSSRKGRGARTSTPFDEEHCAVDVKQQNQHSNEKRRRIDGPKKPKNKGSKGQGNPARQKTSSRSGGGTATRRKVQGKATARPVQESGIPEYLWERITELETRLAMSEGERLVTSMAFPASMEFYGKGDAVFTENGSIAFLLGGPILAPPTEFSSSARIFYPVKKLNVETGMLGADTLTVSSRDIKHAVLVGIKERLEHRGVLTNGGRGGGRTYVLPSGSDTIFSLDGERGAAAAEMRSLIVTTIQARAVPTWEGPLGGDNQPTVTASKGCQINLSSGQAKELVLDLKLGGIQPKESTTWSKSNIDTFELTSAGVGEGRSLAGGGQIGIGRTTRTNTTYTLHGEAELRRMDTVFGGVSWRAGYCSEGDSPEVAVVHTAVLSLIEKRSSYTLKITFKWRRMTTAADYGDAIKRAEAEFVAKALAAAAAAQKKALEAAEAGA